MNLKALVEMAYGGAGKFLFAVFSVEFLVALLSITALLLLTYLAFVVFTYWSSNMETRDTKNPRLYRVKPAWSWHWHMEKREAQAA